MFFARNYCKIHYRRFMRNGHPNLVREEHGMYKIPEYKIWGAMKQRCNNPKDKAYKNYGGRGIAVCKEWQKSFMAFYKDMGKRPEGFTLERIDNNGDYQPLNCRWATRVEQAFNKRLPYNPSGYNGVEYVKGGNRHWRATISINNRTKHLGLFYTALEASIAREKARKERLEQFNV